MLTARWKATTVLVTALGAPGTALAFMAHPGSPRRTIENEVVCRGETTGMQAQLPRA
jgi:hypothetical protein